MAAGGESPSREAVNSTTGGKIRYNPTDICTMNITKSKLGIGNWNVQRLNSPGKIDVLADECQEETTNRPPKRLASNNNNDNMRGIPEEKHSDSQIQQESNSDKGLQQ